jgi:raffinose/stachyose/melibiose transport system permease protein
MTVMETPATVRVVARTAKWLFLGVLTVLTLVPLLWLLLSSFKTTPELFRGPFSLPAHWSFANFSGALDAQPLVDYFRNSVVIAVTSTAMTIIISTLAAYALRHRFRLRGAVNGFLMSGLFVPFTAFMTPIFYLVFHLGLYNTVWGIALVYTGTTLPVGFLIIKGYLETIPGDLLEAARIDGASFHSVFFRIVCPLVVPGLATAAIFLSISAWNELLFANLLSTSTSSETLQVGIRNFLTSYAANYPEAFAGTVMAMAPTILAYALLSNRVVESMAATGLK